MNERDEVKRNEVEQNQPDFERVVEAYYLRLDEAKDATAPGTNQSHSARNVLGDFMRVYPQHADRLMSHAGVASLAEISYGEESSAEQEEAIVRRGMENAARLIAARGMTKREDVPAFTSLRKAAESRGLTILSLATMTNLSVPMLMKLDRRLIRFASIPREAIERLGTSIGLATEAVAAYLQGDAQFATGAHFRSDTAPHMPDQQDFFEAIDKDLTMNEMQKEQWSKLKISSA